MFVIHGEYTEKKEIGVVGDHCPSCGKPRVLRITTTLRQPHLYFIPLGSGQPVGTTMICTGCSSALPWPRERYVEFIPEDQARSMTLGAILWKSNPEFAESVAQRMRLERAAAAWDPNHDTGPDPRYDLAFVKLAEASANDPDAASRLAGRLESWDSLDEFARQRLLHDVEALSAAATREAELVRFVNLAASRLPPVQAGRLIIATFVILASLSFVGMALGLKQFDSHAITFVALLVVAAVLALVVGWQYRRISYRRFFRKNFLPEAEKRSIELRQVIIMLSAIDLRSKATSAGLHSLVRGLPILKEVLGEHQRDLDVSAAEDRHLETASRFD